MIEDIRDAAPGEPASPGGDRKGPGSARDRADEPLVEAEDAGAANDPAAAFAAETASAERLAPAAEPDYKDRWLRAEAEIQNARRRATRDREESVRAAEERILLDMVEVLDDLERALAAMPQEPSAGSSAWAQGVALTAQRLRDALARRGVTPIAAVGVPFDPAFHEALLEVEPPKGIRPGAVVQEVQKGYARDNRALRAARVVVARH